MKQAKKTVARAAWIITTSRGSRKIKITFPWNQDDLDKVKSLPNRKFKADARPKHWECDLSIEAIESLDSWGFQIDPALWEFYENAFVDHNSISSKKTGNYKLDKELYPFQKEALNFIEAREGRTLLAMEQGTGKTIVSLAYMKLHPEIKPVLIVVPAAVKLNWKKEAEKWLNDPAIEILKGKTPYNIDDDTRIAIINYDILKDWQEELKDWNPQLIIFDEQHRLKNSRAMRSKAAKDISRKIPYTLHLSGTPVISRPIEIFNTINMIDRSVFPSWYKYTKRYCNAKKTRFGYDVNGASHLDELHQKLINTIMYRVKKQDVLKDLPDKQISFVPVEIDNGKEYKQAEANFIQFIRETKGRQAARKASNAEGLQRIETLKQVAVKGKMKEVKNWIDDSIKHGKLVVFCTHRKVVEELMKQYGNIAVRYEGGMTEKQKSDSESRFWNDENVKLFIGNIKAAGEGINLQCASQGAFVELGWTASEHDQASDRMHRIGQKNAVNIYYFIATGTIEEKIAKQIDEKRKVTDKTLDGKDTEKSSLLTEIMNEYFEQIEE